jgi:caffeoyl-CoA O-methyltransferase
MANPKSFQLSAEIHDYLIAHGSPPDDIERALIEETAALGDIARMQIAPEQGALLRILTRLLGVTRAVEVGTFTGYSALCIARGLAPGGRLLCCDVSDEWTKIGRRHWDTAGVADRIELRLGPALDTLKSLPREETFDLAFIDADKPNYLAYYEELLPRLRVNGLVIADNVLWSGSVVDAGANDDNVTAIRAFNDHVAGDARVEKVMLPVSDGITLVRKI